ncbi:ethanolamine utilization protein EutJ [Vibrio salinus]|uniref:ethanolamine utilization protein EutJ n=1 Tax=Vibrio salinus TaxID=2899784 RepID=UPI001E599BF7|nr:ethanolamine utilization protein EutJ [Vibrio salinus]MCE0495494.1 ethanolamine utilization protein EutJ [Vibrio salinus]
MSRTKNQRLHELAELVRTGECHRRHMPYKVGVDLGTANIALVVVDRNNRPVTGITYPSTVVKDGVVVDYLTASRVVSELKGKLEKRLGCVLERAATAIPPGISAGDTKVIVNVVESAGFTVTNVVDEPVAAATALNISEGAVVDVGGGTTGMSILHNGKVVFSADEPTGGSHMTLVLSGATGLSYEEAEEMKKTFENEEQVFPVILPVVEKMASLVSAWLVNRSAERLWLVGGASSFKEFAGVFSQITGIPSTVAPEPLLVTPLGIAINAK